MVLESALVPDINLHSTPATAPVEMLCQQRLSLKGYKRTPRIQHNPAEAELALKRIKVKLRQPRQRERGRTSTRHSLPRFKH